MHQDQVLSSPRKHCDKNLNNYFLVWTIRVLTTIKWFGNFNSWISIETEFSVEIVRRPQLDSIKTISASEIIWEMCFSISKPGGVWQLDETMMADGCIFREGRTQLPPVMQSDRPQAGDDYILQFYPSCWFSGLVIPHVQLGDCETTTDSGFLWEREELNNLTIGVG